MRLHEDVKSSYIQLKLLVSERVKELQEAVRSLGYELAIWEGTDARHYLDHLAAKVGRFSVASTYFLSHERSLRERLRTAETELLYYSTLLECIKAEACEKCWGTGMRYADEGLSSYRTCDSCGGKGRKSLEEANA